MAKTPFSLNETSLKSLLCIYFAGTHSLDTRRIRLEPRSHRLALRPPHAPTSSDQIIFGSANTTNGNSFLHDAQGLYTATLDRVTYRDPKKHGQQPSNKYQSNTFDNRRYHTIGIASTASKIRDVNEVTNGTTIHSLLVDPLNKRSNGVYGNTIDSFSHRTNGINGKDDPKKLKKPKSTERLFDDIRREELSNTR